MERLPEANAFLFNTLFCIDMYFHAVKLKTPVRNQGSKG